VIDGNVDFWCPALPLAPIMHIGWRYNFWMVVALLR
jgi:hypothetical protein